MGAKPKRSGGFAVLAVIAGACFIAGSLLLIQQWRDSQFIDLSGAITVLPDEIGITEFGSCGGSDISEGYSDLSVGTGVTVKNEVGEIIATERLLPGSWDDNGCRMEFRLSDVPRSEFYEVEVGRRGAQRYSHEDLLNEEFHLELSIGG